MGLKTIHSMFKRDAFQLNQLHPQHLEISKTLMIQFQTNIDVRKTTPNSTILNLSFNDVSGQTSSNCTTIRQIFIYIACTTSTFRRKTRLLQKTANIIESQLGPDSIEGERIRFLQGNESVSNVNSTPSTIW